MNISVMLNFVQNLVVLAITARKAIFALEVHLFYCLLIKAIYWSLPSAINIMASYMRVTVIEKYTGFGSDLAHISWPWFIVVSSNTLVKCLQRKSKFLGCVHRKGGGIDHLAGRSLLEQANENWDSIGLYSTILTLFTSVHPELSSFV